jgi:hypothetical protein
MTIPASGERFWKRKFRRAARPSDAGDPVLVSPYVPTLHATSSPPALPTPVSSPRSIAFMRQILNQLLGPTCAQYLAGLHATDQSGPAAISSYSPHWDKRMWTAKSG